MLNLFFNYNVVDNINVGDNVLYETFNKDGLQIDRIISQTPKRFKTENGIEIVKSNNTILGDGKLVRLLTEEIEEKLEFYKIALELKRFDFEKLSILQLKEIKLIINNS